jgi:putative glutamine amidotransferase
MYGVPVIGITTRSLSRIPGVHEGYPTGFVVGRAYVDALAAAGALAWPIPLTPEDPDLLAKLVDHIDGLLIPGGTDLDPARYGQEPHPHAELPDPVRDETEIALIKKAIEEGKPLLGICRGMQAINVAAGGTLHQHVGGDLKHDYYDEGTPRGYLAHTVHMEGDSKVRRVLQADEHPVNSLHHQAVLDLGEGFKPTAYAPDGLIEAMELGGHPFAVGVQWHPEELVRTDERMLEFFVEFVNTSLGNERIIQVGA